jgi:undecaprenyl-diphosphatase
MNLFTFETIFSLANQHEWLDILILFCAEYLWIFWTLVIIMILVLRVNTKRERLWNAMPLVFAGASALIANLVSSLIASPRPFLSIPNLETLFVHGGYDAFPSGHTSFMFAFAVSVYALNKPLGYASMIVAVIVGISRVAAGVHWPTDILGGIVLGCVIGGSIFLLKRKFMPPKSSLAESSQNP